MWTAIGKVYVIRVTFAVIAIRKPKFYSTTFERVKGERQYRLPNEIDKYKR